MTSLDNVSNKRKKVFGDRVTRVTTSQMYEIYTILEKNLSGLFKRMTLNKTLTTKTTHGDIDIIVLPYRHCWKEFINCCNEYEILNVVRNGYVNSYLMKFPTLNNMCVHVDIIVASDNEDYMAKKTYFSYNDLSAIIGMLARYYGYKYGSEGFYKRVVDKRGNYHYILITKDLAQTALPMLGFCTTTYNNIQTIDDCVSFVYNSKFYETNIYSSNTMNSRQTLDYKKRPNITYMINKFNELPTLSQTITVDTNIKVCYSTYWAKIENETKLINERIVPKSKYNGEWLMKTFGLTPGPRIGFILKELFNTFKDELDNQDESIVKIHVKRIINNVPTTV